MGEKNNIAVWLFPAKGAISASPSPAGLLGADDGPPFLGGVQLGTIRGIVQLGPIRPSNSKPFSVFALGLGDSLAYPCNGGVVTVGVIMGVTPDCQFRIKLQKGDPQSDI